MSAALRSAAKLVAVHRSAVLHVPLCTLSTLPPEVIAGTATLGLPFGTFVAAARIAVRSVVNSVLVTTPVERAAEMSPVMLTIEVAVLVLRVATPDDTWATELESVASPLVAVLATVLVDVMAAVNVPAAVSDCAVIWLSSVLNSVAMCAIVVVLRLASSDCSRDSWLDASVVRAEATDVDRVASSAACVLTAGTSGATAAAMVAGWIGQAAPKFRLYTRAFVVIVWAAPIAPYPFGPEKSPTVALTAVHRGLRVGRRVRCWLPTAHA